MPMRYIFKVDFYCKGEEVFVLIISSVGPVAGNIFVYDKYLNQLKTAYVGHIDRVEIVKTNFKSFLKLSHYSNSGTDTDAKDIIEFRF